jgi:hypothetical protein
MLYAIEKTTGVRSVLFRICFVISLICVAPIFAADPIINKELTVPRGDYKELHYLIPSETKQNAKAEGLFTCKGGFNDDINFFVFTKAQYVRWLNGYSNQPLVKFEKKKEGKFNIPVMAEETYYFVFDNFFSSVSHKKVKLQVRLK